MKKLLIFILVVAICSISSCGTILIPVNINPTGNTTATVATPQKIPDTPKKPEDGAVTIPPSTTIETKDGKKIEVESRSKTINVIYYSLVAITAVAVIIAAGIGSSN